MEAVPDFAAHYFVGLRAPFLNLSDVDRDELGPILATVEAERAGRSSARIFGRRVMDPNHDRVFRLEPWQEVVDMYGMPVDGDQDHADFQHRPFEKYIEIQVWSDAPLRQHLAR